MCQLGPSMRLTHSPQPPSHSAIWPTLSRQIKTCRDRCLPRETPSQRWRKSKTRSTTQCETCVKPLQASSVICKGMAKDNNSDRLTAGGEGKRKAERRQQQSVPLLLQYSNQIGNISLGQSVLQSARLPVCVTFCCVCVWLLFAFCYRKIENLIIWSWQNGFNMKSE